MNITQTSKIYRVLREVAVLNYDVPVDVIAECVGMSAGQIRSIARRISSQYWDCWAPSETAEKRGHPWVDYNVHNDTISMTSDGHRALAHAKNNLHLTVKTIVWKNEVLTGITPDGHQTRIENAVLSSAGLKKPGRKDPELSFIKKQNMAVYGVSHKDMPRYAHSNMMWCSCCHKKGRMPFHSPKRFRLVKKKNGHVARRHECKMCERESRDARESRPGK